MLCRRQDENEQHFHHDRRQSIVGTAAPKQHRQNNIPTKMKFKVLGKDENGKLVIGGFADDEDTSGFDEEEEEEINEEDEEAEEDFFGDDEET